MAIYRSSQTLVVGDSISILHQCHLTFTPCLRLTSSMSDSQTRASLHHQGSSGRTEYSKIHCIWTSKLKNRTELYGPGSLFLSLKFCQGSFDHSLRRCAPSPRPTRMIASRSMGRTNLLEIHIGKDFTKREDTRNCSDSSGQTSF
jgi:hypothetical protein